MKFLFIGGTADGQWIEVEDHNKPVQLPLPQDLAKSVYKDIEVRTIIYVPEYVKSAGATIKIFRFKEMTGTQALAQLVRKYVA